MRARRATCHATIRAAVLSLALGAALAGAAVPSAPPAPDGATRCTYRIWSWNVAQRVAVQHRTVEKPRAELRPAERDPTTGCSVCSEDQAWIGGAGLPRVQVCGLLAPGIEYALRDAQARGARIDALVGYRPSLTRGEIDADGNRSGFSNHSFGVALDVNPAHNGLYDRCEHFGPACRLREGGAWDPRHPAGLRRDHPLVVALATLGLRWGGELAGDQKDFMHFSPTGY